MKIVTLGTGHGTPNQRRHNSCILVQIADHFYLLDAGDGAATELIRAGYSAAELDLLWVSHLHDDHVGGIAPIIQEALKYHYLFPDKNFRIFLPEEKAPAGLRAWLDTLEMPETLADLAIESYAAGKVYSDDVITLTAYPTRHIAPDRQNRPRSYAAKIQTATQTLIYTGDLSRDFSDFPEDAIPESGCDVLICELTHYPLEVALPILRQIRCRKLIFTHVHDPWDSPTKRLELLAASRTLPYPMMVAEDGQVFEI